MCPDMASQCDEILSTDSAFWSRGMIVASGVPSGVKSLSNVTGLGFESRKGPSVANFYQFFHIRHPKLFRNMRIS